MASLTGEKEWQGQRAGYRAMGLSGSIAQTRPSWCRPRVGCAHGFLPKAIVLGQSPSPPVPACPPLSRWPCLWPATRVSNCARLAAELLHPLVAPVLPAVHAECLALESLPALAAGAGRLQPRQRNDEPLQARVLSRQLNRSRARAII